MGNVSSAERDKVNELLTTRAKRKIIDRNRKRAQQQQATRLGTSPSSSASADGIRNIISSIPIQGQDKGHAAYAPDSHPYAHSSDFFASSSAGSDTKSMMSVSTSISLASTRAVDMIPHSPASPSFSIPSSATTPTSASSQQYDTVLLSGSRTDDRSPDASSVHPCEPPPRRAQYSLPIVIPQPPMAGPVGDECLAPQGTRSTGTSIGTGTTGYIPVRRGSEHHLHLLQQQQQQPSSHPVQHQHQHQQHQQMQLQLQQSGSDPQPLGTSPEARDWLKQKPTRSSTHLMHQYNFQNRQFYQPSGTSMKIVNNTCRNMAGYADVPSLSRPGSANLNYTSINTASALGNKSVYPSSSPPSASSHAQSNSTSTLSTANGTGPPQSRQPYSSAPLPSSSVLVGTSRFPTGTPSTPTSISATSGTSLNTSAPPQRPQGKDLHLGKMVMSRSKLNTPLASTTLSPGQVSSQVLGSPLELVPGSNLETQRPRLSSTISSLRSLLGNHPQGLSLIESLEEEEEEDGESMSETESAESEADLTQRMQSLSATMNGALPQGAGLGEETSESMTTRENTNSVRRVPKKRPPPRFEWMTERRRFSSADISTISLDIQDSQKGQHALWKYIGGGNSHAPLSFEIERILDSGCGLGEWTMEMAKEYPNATVYGIDINPELFPSVTQSIPSNCLFTRSDLLTRLSFPDGYFDFVFQRFLYLGLTADDWPVALKELRRVMKPGAWIELFEPCMRVHRAGPRTREVMRWCSRLLQEERGLDFDFAGEKMKRLCESEEIGFQNVQLRRLSIPVGWSGRVGQAMAENMVLIFQHLRSAFVGLDSQTLNEPAHRAFDAMVQSWIRECEENKSYIDYYILIAQRAP
ncbi:hypothetical protein BGW38_004030 [Lunasporangiospora selenospora]|uniref:Methyltransferase domain-containing protein n=1 Tax=Lunasporangiospora selenospora TaxID=979761 RepID=A0A9P6FQ91_9FUNG|nr:hypothetical protein BGW38_004030 [Lunasporangiospora selenospora]